ncbi:MAG: hypothetical protein HY514_01380 [Candidatus Aenigmarchaeota archaeon]|nr:hypothetical protein [Candidatus Aenigmarchaeota archaeon]
MYMEIKMSHYRGKLSDLLSRYSGRFELQPPVRMKNVRFYICEEKNGVRTRTLTVSKELPWDEVLIVAAGTDKQYVDEAMKKLADLTGLKFEDLPPDVEHDMRQYYVRCDQ